MKRTIAVLVMASSYAWAGQRDANTKPCPGVVESEEPNASARKEVPLRMRVSEAVAKDNLFCQPVVPVYPVEARAKKLEGKVILYVVIGTNGSVKKLKVLSGDPLFVDSAIEAVRQWRYKPYKFEGKPVELETQITVQFKLDKKNSQPASPTGN